MKKLILGLLLLAVAVLVGGNFYYTQQIAKRLDKASMMVAGMGGDMEYRDVDITPQGQVRIEGVFLRMPGMGGALNIQQILVHTGSPLGVHALAMDISDRRLPKSLGVSFEGVRLPLSTDSQVDETAGLDALAAAGCGDRTGFGVSDLLDMGYSELVTDTRLDYRFIGGGQLLNIDLVSEFEGMHRTHLTTELSLGAPSLDAAMVGMALTGAELLSLHIDYTDRGYTERTLAFCQEQTGLDRSDYIAHHLEAWRAQLNRLGFEAGPNTVEAYRTFLAEPDQVSLAVKPSGALNVSEASRLTPELLLAHLNTTLSVNGQPMGRLDLAVRDSGALVEEPVLGAEEPEEDTPAVHRPSVFESEDRTEPSAEPQRLSLDRLGQHLNRDVEVQLNDGRSLEGHIQSLHELSLQFKHFRNGGYVVMPIQYRNIEAVYLR